MNSKLNSVVIVALAMMLSACSPDNKLADERGKLLTDVATADQLSARIQWQQNFNLSDAHRVRSISVLGNRLAVVEGGNVVVVLDAGSGRIVWQQVVGDYNENLGLPTRFDKQLFIASESILYIYDIDSGNLDQQFHLARMASTRPVVDESQVVFGSPSGRVFAHLLHSGVLRWEYNMNSAIVTTPVTMSGMLVVVDQTGSLAMLNSANGHIVWRDSKPPYSPVVAQPIIANSITYVASTDQKLYAFDRISGHVIWQFPSERPLTADPVAIGDRIYQRTADQGLVCLDGLNGEVYWKSEAPGQPLLMRGRNLWLRDRDALVFVDPATGTVLKTVPMPASVKITVADTDADALYLSTPDGRVLKLGLK